MATIETFEENNDNKTNVNKNVSFPYKIKPVDPEIDQELLSLFKGVAHRSGHFEVGPKKWFFPNEDVENAPHCYNLEIRQDDVFVATFPRSGTTWTQEMVWLINNNLDYKTAYERGLETRYAWLDGSSWMDKKTTSNIIHKYGTEETVEQSNAFNALPRKTIISEMTGRRFIKTHLPFSLLPPDLLKSGCKVVYVARNPKDVAVSYYHLHRSLTFLGYTGSFQKFWELFCKNLIINTPFWEHVKEGWSRRTDKNVLFLFYEDLNKDLKSGLKKLSAFFDKEYTESELAKLEEHLNIENFRKNKSVNGHYLKEAGLMVNDEEEYIRKGKIGGWKEYFDEKMNAQADQWIEGNLKDTDLKFPI